MINPEISVFSTGRNSYGHPDLRVYRTLKQMGHTLITGGADPRVYRDVRKDIVEADIELVVSPGGRKYWVQGEAFTALSEEEEARRPGRLEGCAQRDRVRDLDRPDDTGPLHED